MCLSPITIRNKKYRLGTSTNVPLFLRVPCGKCAECRKAKANEYTVRSYAEYKYTKNCDGWTYFETLTYNDKCCPKYRDMLVFNPAHFRNFMKRLRIILVRNGFDVAHNLKYYFASEYGGKTHRPHYHVIFFCRIPNLDVMTFRDLVNKCWVYGFIDRRYTVYKRVVNGLGACKYISEYVNKDYEFSKYVDAKVLELEKNGVIISPANKKRLKCFHRQSINFGVDALNQNKKELLDKFMVQLPDKWHEYKIVPMGTYLKRKYCMVCVDAKDVEYQPVIKYRKSGKEFEKYDYVCRKHWQYLPYGKWLQDKNLNSSLAFQSLKLRTLYLNYNTYKADISFVKQSFCERVFDEFLKNHTFGDLAVYQRFRRGRFLISDVDIYTQIKHDFMDDDSFYFYNKDGYLFTKWRNNSFDETNVRVYKDKVSKYYRYLNLPFSAFAAKYAHFEPEFEDMIAALQIVSDVRSHHANSVYFAKCEYRARKKCAQ